MKKRKTIIICLIIISSAFLLYDLLHPVKIKGVHVLGEHYTENSLVVVVEHFPVTLPARKWWWHKNQAWLQHALPLPKDPFLIMVVHRGEGYQTPEHASSDAFCFDDIPSGEKCIDKNFLMDIRKAKEGQLSLSSSNWFYLSESVSFYLSMLLVAFYCIFSLPLLLLSLIQAWLTRKSRSSLFYRLL